MIRNFIFTITAGRTGTRYLSDLLQNCEGVLAEHEAQPTPGTLLRRMNLGMDHTRFAEAYAALKAESLIHMDQEVRRAHQTPGWTCHTYADTSHVLGKTVLHPSSPFLVDALRKRLLEYGRGPADVQIIHLTRDKRRTAESLLSIGMWPSLWPNPLGFGLTPDHPYVEPWPGWLDLVHMPAPMNDETIPGRLALVLWYLRQIDLFAQAAREAWPGKVHQVDIAALNTQDNCEAFVAKLGLRFSGHEVNVIGKPRNTAEQRGHARIVVTRGHWQQAEGIFGEWLASR